MNRDEVTKGQHFSSKNGSDYKNTAWSSLGFTTQIVLTLKGLRYAYWPDFSNLAAWEMDIKNCLTNFYQQHLSTFWEVGSTQKIPPPNNLQAVQVRLADKNMDCWIVGDPQNFLQVEITKSKSGQCKVLMNEKLSMIEFDIDGKKVTCRKSMKADGLKIVFQKKVTAEKVVVTLNAAIDRAKKSEISYLKKILESYDTDLKSLPRK